MNRSGPTIVRPCFFLTFRSDAYPLDRDTLTTGFPFGVWPTDTLAPSRTTSYCTLLFHQRILYSDCPVTLMGKSSPRNPLFDDSDRLPKKVSLRETPMFGDDPLDTSGTGLSDWKS